MLLKRRKGKWTSAEESYAHKLIYYFKKGMLPNLISGKTLRSYLSEKLMCDPMRITKKCARSLSIGRCIYVPMHPFPSSESLLKCIDELETLESSFWDSLRAPKSCGHDDDHIRQDYDKNYSKSYKTTNRCHNRTCNRFYNHYDIYPTHNNTGIDESSELKNDLEKIHRQSMLSLDSENSCNNSNLYRLDDVTSVSDSCLNVYLSKSSSRSMISSNGNEDRSLSIRGDKEFSKFDMNLNEAANLLLSFANQSYNETNSMGNNYKHSNIYDKIEVEIDNKCKPEDGKLYAFKINDNAGTYSKIKRFRMN